MKDVVSRIFVGSLSCLIAFSNSAIASEKGTFSSAVGARVTYDDNLYKINKDSEQIRLLLPDFNFSDTINTVFANAEMNWDVSQQEFLASVGVSENKFSNNSQLDNTAVNYNAKWNWYFNRLFSGNIGYSKDRKLANFRDNLNAALLASKIDNDIAEFTMNWQLHSHWHTQIGVRKRNTDYSVDALNFNNKSVIASNAKLIYETLSQNTFSISAVREDIAYDNRSYEIGSLVDDEYSLSTIILASTYNYSQKTQISARLAWRELQPEHLETSQSFDISDLGYNFSYSWKPSTTMVFTALIAEELSPSENINTDFQRTKMISLGMSWQVLSKVSVGLQTEYNKRRYEFNSNLQNTLENVSENTYRNAEVNIVYKPNMNIELQVGYQFNSQRSDLLIRNFDSNSTYATIIAIF